MFKDLGSNFRSSLVYLKASAFTFILFSCFLILLIDSAALLILLIAINLIINLVMLNLLGQRRKNEINEITEVIRKIKNGDIKKDSEILLNNSLNSIETEIRELFIKNKGNIEYLKKLERMRTEFIGNTSHELRTPIFAIQGFIETLLGGALEDPEVNRLFLEKANRHTVSLNNLLNDLIDISMIESGEMRMHFRYFNMNEYVTGIVEEFKPQAAKKNLYLNFTPAPKNLSLFGDKEKIRQALTNLIQNAIKYTDNGGVDVIIEEESKFGKITVKDTGIGISDDNLSRIFERFYRADKGRSRDVGGTGLGLAIVKHIIEAHNSKIEVKSEINKGSEFSFRLKK